MVYYIIVFVAGIMSTVIYDYLSRRIKRYHVAEKYLTQLEVLFITEEQNAQELNRLRSLVKGTAVSFPIEHYVPELPKPPLHGLDLPESGELALLSRGAKYYITGLSGTIIERRNHIEQANRALRSLRKSNADLDTRRERAEARFYLDEVIGSSKLIHFLSASAAVELVENDLLGTGYARHATRWRMYGHILENGIGSEDIMPRFEEAPSGIWMPKACSEMFVKDRLDRLRYLARWVVHDLAWLGPVFRGKSTSAGKKRHVRTEGTEAAHEEFAKDDRESCT